jgi:drug/metabolite transporter (DMT)-like permease
VTHSHVATSHQRASYSTAGVLAVLTAVVLWGVQLPVAALAFAHVDPYHLTSIRYAVTALLLVPLLVYQEGAGALRYRNRAWDASAAGIAGTCISPMLTYVGLSLSQPEHAVVISALQPLMVALAERVLRGRRLAAVTLVCIVLAMLGVTLVVTEGTPLTLLDTRQLAGDALIFLGAIAWVAFAMTRERFADWSTLSFTTLTIIPGTIATIVITALLLSTGFVSPLASSDLVRAWPELLYLSLGSALLAMLCWNAGNRRIGALNAMLLINLQPVVTFAVRYVQGYTFSAFEIIGAVIVVAALMANTLHLRSLR